MKKEDLLDIFNDKLLMDKFLNFYIVEKVNSYVCKVFTANEDYRKRPLKMEFLVPHSNALIPEILTIVFVWKQQSRDYSKLPDRLWNFMEITN